MSTTNSMYPARQGEEHRWIYRDAEEILLASALQSRSAITTPSCSLASFLIDYYSPDASPGREILNPSQRPSELLRSGVRWI